MASPFCRVIQGQFVVIGKEPDGDSVRFVADDLELYRELRNQFRIKPNRNDRSVQLRFEAVDAPEVHYGTAAQPLGTNVRDALLERMGFANVEFEPTNPNRVKAAAPAAVRGCILSKAADVNGRPISYVLLEEDAERLADGDWMRVDDEVLRRTINYYLLEIGLAYLTVYTSTAAAHRTFLRRVAGKARKQERGVWKLDSTNEFVLEDQASINRNGQLLLPKLFRRCTDYLKDAQKGFEGNLADWLRRNSAGSRNENDLVVINDWLEVPLSDLLEQRNRTIVFQPDILDLTFVEK